MTQYVPLENALPVGVKSGPRPTHFLVPPEFISQTTSIGSAVIAQLTIVTNQARRQITAETEVKGCSNRPHPIYAQAYIHIRTHITFNGPLSGTTRVSRYQKR